MPEIHPKMKEVKENKFALLPRSQARQGGRQVDRPLRIRNVFCNQDRSNDASTNAGILLISGLQPEDEADYYCATYHGNSKAFTELQTHGEVRQKSPHCSALLCSTSPSIGWALRTAQTEPLRHPSVPGQRPSGCGHIRVRRDLGPQVLSP